MNVVFAGTPEFAATALARIVEAGHQVSLVLTQPDRPAGRGLKPLASAVKQMALAHGLAVAQPRSLRLDGRFADDALAAQALLRGLGADVMVVAAYGLILPAWVLQMPRLGCLNIHGSLLPRWRGAAPVQRAIEAGDATTGVTIMQMDEGLDTGAMIRHQATPITGADTTNTLLRRLAGIGADLVVDTLAAAGVSAWRSLPQPDTGVNYAHKIDRREAGIDWSADAALIERRVRAFDPFPGASFVLDGEVVKVWRAAVAAGPQGAAGTVVAAESGRLAVACGTGTLNLLELQRPGGRRQPVAAFMASRPGLVIGHALGPPSS